MRLLASSSEVALVGSKAERRHRAGDDQALDGFIVDDQETSSGIDLRVHVISGAARSTGRIVATRHEEAVKRQPLTRRGASGVLIACELPASVRRCLCCWPTGGIRRARRRDRYFVTSDGVRLHYLEAGQRLGHTIVFVPGWTMPAWIWQPQIQRVCPALSRRRIRSARSGRLRTHPASGYEPGRRSQDIAELIANLEPVPVLLVGWSLGVLDTLAYVREHGDEMVAGLVLVDNSVGEEPPPAASAPRRPVPALPHAIAMHRFVLGMFHHRPSESYLDRLTEATLRTPERASRALLAYPVAAHLLA